MNVLLIGSGGREHAIALSISKSPLLDKLYCITGNPGTKRISINLNIAFNDFELLKKFVKENRIDLVVIGPEQPLVDGLSDFFRIIGVPVFGPSSNAARIESSKSYAKEIMNRANVPTASYREFNSKQLEEAKEYLSLSNFPVVIKADGLAAGKGVVICDNLTEAISTIDSMVIKKSFGLAGEKFLIEEFLQGDEASVFAITDGKDFVVLPAAQDHKRIGDNDTGKNTGGMGAYAPTPLITNKLIENISENIIKPVIDQMNKEGNPFIGCLYAGLMITDDGPKVIEFNCRFGDPETQVVLPLLEGDLLKLLYSAATGKIDESAIKYSGGSAVCVILASEGYPDSFEKGFEITGIDEVDPDIIVYHAGTVEKDNKVYTNGGRVLGVTSVIKENDILKARQKAYDAVQKVHFQNMYYRKDIASKVIKYL